MQGGASATQVPPTGSVAAENKDDMEFLDKMRGWLMTVAALFINMAFMAVLHPPECLNTEWYRVGFRSNKKPNDAALGHHSAAVTGGEITRSLLFLFCNAGTFTSALTLLLMLLYAPRTPSNAKRTMTFSTIMSTGISIFVACTFSVATADNWYSLLSY